MRLSVLVRVLPLALLSLLSTGASCGGDETDGPEPGPSGGELGERWVAAHNAARAAATPAPSPALPPMRWDTPAAAVARLWAENCRFEHNAGRGAHGENLYAMTGGAPTPEGVVQSWASEVEDYDYASNTCASGKQCGHYTQVVWRSTDRVGCAVQACTRNSPFQGASEWVLVVCNYAPPGNYVGQRPY